MPAIAATAAAATALPKKSIVYLLGAGATHAELASVYPERKLDGAFWEKRGLLLADVSKRVCEGARQDHAFPRHVDQLLAPTGLSNIELFFSLLQENEIRSTAEVIRKLTLRMERDIAERLRRRRNRFYLHKALFELHKTIVQEKLAGVISLNYDDVVDEAYRTVWEQEPNHCLTSDASATSGASAPIPLLKLHGGFTLKYRKKRLQIVTPGINKNYLALPYSLVWGRALELLLDCDVLRVIGCSLNQNDVGIVDLLFKAHVNRAGPPPILQIIDFDPENNRIREHFGFFPQIERALAIEGRLIGDVDIRDSSKGSNPFKIWLKAKIERVMKPEEIQTTRFVKKVLQ